MPEGDTIHKLALALGPELRGTTVAELWLRSHGVVEGLAGERVGDAEARGKNLLVHLGGRWTLLTHLGLHGDVHLYAPGERWRRPRASATASLAADAAVVVWMAAKRAELVRRRDLDRHPALAPLGPDLLGPEVDEAAIVARARAGDPGRTIAEVLLDQKVAAGIGNVYRNELLFLSGLDPARPLSSVADETLAELFLAARSLLLENLGPGPRRTRPRSERDGRGPRSDARLWVYGRDGRPCLRCGAPIRRIGESEAARVTFGCPHCQR